MHRAKNDYPLKANLAEGKDTIVAVISQVNLGLPDTSVQTEMCLTLIKVWGIEENKFISVIPGQLLS